jgi:thiamine kinase-like enzyme
MPSETVNLVLSKDEALALFTLTSRFSDTDKLTIEHQAEKRLLWTLCCLLEKTLAEPFQGNDHKMLKQAQEHLEDRTE